jgi:hypothetical protein
MMRRLLASVLVVAAVVLAACTSKPEPGSPKLTELQRTKSGNLDVVLLAKTDALAQGKSQATLEFQSGNDHHLVDVGTVKVGASMEMPGMGPMLGSVVVDKGDAPGRYTLATDLTMTGTWKLTVQWQGPAGTGSVTLPGTVR